MSNKLVNLKDVEKNLPIIIEQTEDIVCTTQEEFDYLQTVLSEVATRKKLVTEKMAEPKKKAHEAHKAVTALEKELLAPYEGYEKLAKKAISNYMLEQERLAQEKIKKAEEKKAELLEKLGDSGDEFAEFLDLDITAPKIAIETNKGVSSIDDWEVEVVDIYKVPLEIAGVVVMEVKLGEVKKLVKKFGGDIKIPGIKITPKKQIRVRGGR